MPRARIISEVAGKIWKIEAALGSTVQADDPVVTLESMKMEIPAASPIAGKVVELHVAEGDLIVEGQLLAVVDSQSF